MSDLLTQLEALDEHFRNQGGSLASVVAQAASRIFGYPPFVPPSETVTETVQGDPYYASGDYQRDRSANA